MSLLWSRWGPLAHGTLILMRLQGSQVALATGGLIVSTLPASHPQLFTRLHSRQTSPCRLLSSRPLQNRPPSPPRLLPSQLRRCSHHSLRSPRPGTFLTGSGISFILTLPVLLRTMCPTRAGPSSSWPPRNPSTWHIGGAQQRQVSKAIAQKNQTPGL